MAIDTQDKRASAINPSLPWRGYFPQPNSAIDQGDRQQAAALYRGILAGAAPDVEQGGGDYIILRRRRRGR